MYHPTFFGVLFCFIFWITSVLIYVPATVGIIGKRIQASYPLERSKLILLFVLITIYSVFEFAGGDFFHYKEFYEQVHDTGTDQGLDSIYLWLIELIPNNFYLWRLAIWGPAAFLWVIIIKRLGYSPKLAGCLFFLVVFFLFVGARQALGFCTIYLGITLILKSTRSLDTFCGLLLFFSAAFLHSTMIVYMLLLILSILPLKKRFILISLLIFPIVYKFFGLFIEKFLVCLDVYNYSSSDTFVKYLESEYRREYNIIGYSRIFIDRLPIFILLFMSIKDVYWKNLEMHRIYRCFLIMTYVLIYISFLFVGRDVSAYIAPRFWDASLFPLTLFLGGYLSRKKSNHSILLAMALLIISKVFTYLYIFYKL